MHVDPNGHLCLGRCDLFDDRRKQMEEMGELPNPTLNDFSPDAWVAASYANRAGYCVFFSSPGQKIRRIKGNEYFPEKKFKVPKGVVTKPELWDMKTL